MFSLLLRRSRVESQHIIIIHYDLLLFSLNSASLELLTSFYPLNTEYFHKYGKNRALFSSNQVYLTIQTIKSHIKVKKIRINNFFVFSGGHFCTVAAEMSSFYPLRTEYFHKHGKHRAFSSSY